MRVVQAELHFLPVPMRVPLKFGAQVLTEVTCARVCLTVEDGATRTKGWGETPLNVGWVWPSSVPYEERHQRLQRFCQALAQEFCTLPHSGHPFSIGQAYQSDGFEALHSRVDPGMPHLAALVCLSAFDLALYDAFGNLHQKPVFETLSKDWLPADLSSPLGLAGRYPADYLLPRQTRLPVWHLVGGLDPIDESELHGSEPDDGYPVLLRDWIRRDGLNCLKIKLRGNDADWDYTRLLAIGNIAIEEGAGWLTTDFNCMVTDPAYVTEILDRLVLEAPRVYGMILYVEQPFPYDLEANQIDVHAVSARKPLFMDESAHDWQLVRLGRQLGWTGVALKTCKTLTGALLSLCWAKAHGMTLMVQDLTNPMLAQISHVTLAAHAGTIMGVESNGMQFYPEASAPEAAVHPGLYRRRDGLLDLSTLGQHGFGYRLSEIGRSLA
ncbi:MAG: L-alanine-DL-glutamate epimerase-like enolase superfamily enzyme [Rhodothermales bacterium]|jgi:L-alanine-DL-glutamate epimerase-like enolase superfamily enzyme